MIAFMKALRNNNKLLLNVRVDYTLAQIGLKTFVKKP